MENKYFNHPIFLIEDNPVDIDLTLRAFEKQHLINPIIVARDGEEALNTVEHWSKDEPLPVVILLDLQLPRIHGLKVLKGIKEDARFKIIPVVILTTSSEQSDIKTAYEMGANSYIEKPVDFDKFMEVVAQIELYWNVLNKKLL
ncbi:MAG: response regulator [Bacteroidales bacterium]|nr:response regulator [Bacteroidales bacterium]